MLRRVLSHGAIALFWLLHFLPLPVLARVGQGLGALLYRVGGRRRRIAQTNLALCFPELDEAQRSALLRQSFTALGIGLFASLMMGFVSRV